LLLLREKGLLSFSAVIRYLVVKVGQMITDIARQSWSAVTAIMALVGSARLVPAEVLIVPDLSAMVKVLYKHQIRRRKMWNDVGKVHNTERVWNVLVKRIGEVGITDTWLSESVEEQVGRCYVPTDSKIKRADSCDRSTERVASY
jgi:hypothetical protein